MASITPPVYLYIKPPTPSIFQTPIRVLRGEAKLSCKSPAKFIYTTLKIAAAAFTVLAVLVATLSIIGLPVTYFFFKEWNRQIKSEEEEKVFTREYNKMRAEIHQEGEEIRRRVDAAFNERPVSVPPRGQLRLDRDSFTKAFDQMQDQFDRTAAEFQSEFDAAFNELNKDFGDFPS